MSSVQDFKLAIKVKPFSSKSKIIRFSDGIFEVAIAAKPKDGEANEELRSLLSEVIGIPRSKVLIDTGHISRNKLVIVSGLSPEEVIGRLDVACKKEKEEA